MNDLDSSICSLVCLLKTRKREGSRHEMMRDNATLEKLNITFMEEVVDTFEIIQRLMSELMQ